MSTTVLRHSRTPKAQSLVAYPPTEPSRQPPADVAYVRAVVAAIGQCDVHAGGWRRKDVLRGRPNPINGLFKLLRELKEYGATATDLEGVNLSLYNAGRTLALEGLPRIANETLAEAIRKEQEIESAENVDSIDVLMHPTPGNLRKLRASMIAECEAQRHVIELIDAELLKIEGR
jgi:hypothetical protein